MKKNNIDISSLISLYKQSLSSNRSGPLYNAFSYPTKISPESIGIFLATHTKPGSTVLDVFGGSGTVGMAAHLCARPTDQMLKIAKNLDISCMWGPRHAIVYELGVLGSFIAKVINSPPKPDSFAIVCQSFLSRCQEAISTLYRAKNAKGELGSIRHVIWSEFIICPHCKESSTFWQGSVQLSPVQINPFFKCPHCKRKYETDKCERQFEKIKDSLLNKPVLRKCRIPVFVYGSGPGKQQWSRPATEHDIKIIQEAEKYPISLNTPIVEIPWGDLHRSGYHKGITHVHHFYTPRNLAVMSTIWSLIKNEPIEYQDALRFLVLSYNSSHSTLMTRVVVKDGERDFILTGAQTGVLYISNLPVEKNILFGLQRKSKTIIEAFRLIHNSGSTVNVINGSSTKLDLPNNSVDYVFTDPPFGDYIPYSEINLINESWLGTRTNTRNEVVISSSQGKTVNCYKNLMSNVFREIERVLKPNGKFTLVFHSAQAKVWEALQQSYSDAGLEVVLSSILDKQQRSFKQINSTITVKHDPLLLLTKSTNTKNNNRDHSTQNISQIIHQLLARAISTRNVHEQTKERLYSRLIGYFLERGKAVPVDAGEFYHLLANVK